MKKKMAVIAIILLLIIAGSVFFFTQPRRVDLGAAAPETGSVAEPVMEPRWSLVSTRLRAEREELQSFLEGEAGDWSYSEERRGIEVPFGRAWGDLEVVPSGIPLLDLRTGIMILEVPLQFRARVHWEGEILGLTPSLSEDFEGALLARVLLRPRFTPQWRLQTNARIEFEWTQEPSVELLGYRISLRRWIDPALEKWLGENTDRIDTEVNEELRLAERAAEEWRNLARPVELRSDPGLWLSIRPLAVHIPVPSIDSSGFEARVMIPLSLRLVSGEEPPAVDPGPLPALETEAPRMDGLNLAVPVLLHYADLEREARRHFEDSPILFGDGGILEVRDVSLRGGGGELLAGFDVGGRMGRLRLEGTVYLRGRPRLDPESGVIRIEDLRFDTVTRDRLSSVAAWLLEPLFLERFAEGLVFPVERDLAEARQELEEDFRERRLDDNLVLRGSILRLGLTRIFPVADGLVLEVEASGHAELDFEVRQGAN